MYLEKSKNQQMHVCHRLKCSQLSAVALYLYHIRRKKVASTNAEATIVREVKLLQRLLNSNSHGNGHTDLRPGSPSSQRPSRQKAAFVLQRNGFCISYSNAGSMSPRNGDTNILQRNHNFVKTKREVT